MIDQKEKLKQRVMDYVRSQPGYNAKDHEALDAFCEDKENYMVIYGEDLMAGIAGVGETPDLAFNDFVRSWKELNGFDWIKKNR